MSTPTSTVPLDATSTSASTSTESCFTAVPDKYGYVDPAACNANYWYNPSFPANLAFAILMGLTTLVHITQAALYRKKYCWVLIMGAAWETFSFSMKTAGTRDQQQIVYPILGTLFLLLAPLWINAFLYMTIARLVYYTIPDQKVLRIPAIVLTKVFVWLDILSFVIQGTGGSLMSAENGATLMRIGQNVYIGGIAFQAFLIVIFSVGTASFYRKLGIEGRVDRPIGRTKVLIWVLLANFALIMVRIIFRMVEFIPGHTLDNPLIANEIYILVLDALPMLIGLVLLNAVHPGLVLRGEDSEFPKPSRSAKKELKKAEKEAKKEDKRQRKAAKKQGKGGSWSEGHDQNVGSVDRASEYARAV